MSLLPRLVARSAAVRASTLLPIAARQPLQVARVRYVSGYGTNAEGGNESGMPPIKGNDQTARGAAPNVQSSNTGAQKQGESSGDVPLSEQMKEMKSELQDAGHEMMEGMKSTFNTFKDKVNSKLDEQQPEMAQMRDEGSRAIKRGAAKIKEGIKDATADKPRHFHSFAARRIDQDTISSSMTKAGRKIKAAVANVVGSSPAESGSEMMRTKDQWSESSPVRDAANSQTLSTRGGQHGANDNTPAGTIEPVMEPVKSAMWDGPQEMPQGVGKRAPDQEGRPMETGSPRT